MNPDLIKPLSDACELEYWEEAEKQARRSTLSVFKTGAVIFNHKTGDIVGRGCSHHSEYVGANSEHAEAHALRTSYGLRNYGNYHPARNLSIVIFTLGRSRHLARSSRPCQTCAIRMQEQVQYVYWPEQDNGGNWIINKFNASSLAQRVILGKNTPQYAREDRIC